MTLEYDILPSTWGI